MVFVGCDLPSSLNFVEQIAKVNKSYYIPILTSAFNSETRHYTSHSKYIYYPFIYVYICVGLKIATVTKPTEFKKFFFFKALLDESG